VRRNNGKIKLTLSANDMLISIDKALKRGKKMFMMKKREKLKN
jgi:hypothetical protein